jgi:hypothetical protein
MKHIRNLKKYILEKNFSLPEGFLSKSNLELRDAYNGIGAEWMPSLLRRLITKLFGYMEPAALVHDIDFLNPVKSFKNFTIANLRLIYNSAKCKHLFSGLVAGIICQFFGWSAWIEGKETMAWYYYYQEEDKK